MKSELIKKNIEELSKKIDSVKTNISKINEQLEQLKSEESQLIGAIQYAGAIANMLESEEKDGVGKTTEPVEVKEAKEVKMTSK